MGRLEEVLSTLSHYPGTTLVAVSKTVGREEIIQAYTHGLRHFGENKVQDALPKMESITLPVDWHFIGRLQTNKVRKIAGKFALVHSLDNLRLATELNRVGQNTGHTFKCLVQVNASREETKQGLAPHLVAEFLYELQSLPAVRVLGLMTMAPATGKDIIRRTFRSVRRLYEELSKMSLPGGSMEYLSMGMSGDYQIALEEGSNMLRIGSAIFGSGK